MYYSDEVVEEVLRGNDIVDVISAYVHLKKSGANYFGVCPFHNEKTGSFSVSAGKQMFYCFGCGEGGNAATFLMKYENLTFQEALQKLAERAGITLPQVQLSDEIRKKEQQKSVLLQINKEAATYYYKLLRTPKGRTGQEYFAGRKLSPETMNRFGLGYADGRSSDLVRFLREKGYRDEDILASGTAAFEEARGLHDKFFNRVMFPIMDGQGRVIGFGGRVLGDGKPKYLNSPETQVFDKSHNLYGLHLARRSRKDYFILCEGYMDVIAMHQAGFSEAVASLGTSFTAGQAVLIKRFVKKVYLSYDSDEAGVRAAIRNIGILKEAGIDGKVIDLRPYKDPDEFIKALGSEEFSKRIEGAENSFLYEIRQMEKEFDLSDPAQRTAFYRAAARKLCEFEDELERENYLSAVAEKYMIRRESLRRMVASYQLAGGSDIPQARPAPVSTAGEKKKHAANDALRRKQRMLLTWLSEEEDLYPIIREYLTPEDFEEGIYRQAAEKFLSRLENGGFERSLPSGVIASFETEEEQREAASLFEEHLEGLTTDSDREKALQDILISLRSETIARMSGGSGADNMMKVIKAKQELEKLRKLRFLSF